MTQQSNRRTLLAGGLAGLALAGAARGVSAAPPLGCDAPPCPYPTVTGWRGARTALRDLLQLNLLPFWRRIADESRGEGYELNHDLAGRWLGPSDPGLVSQARVLWFFAHLRRHGFAEAADAARADRGYAILTRRFRDPAHGGYFWRLNRTDLQPRQADKQLYGQAFALFALAEHALATGDPAHAAAAVDAFDAIDRHMRDPAAGNYHEFRLRDWSAPPPGGKDYQNEPVGTRTQNTRIHLLEALTTFHELQRTSLSQARLAEVMALTEGALVRRPAFFFRETDTPPFDHQTYGHDTEAIHLLMRARAQLGRCDPPPGYYRRVLDDALRLGEDAVQGGIRHSGPAGQPPDRLDRRDWVQAETLLATLELFRQYRAAAHKAAFLRQLNWIGRWQVDWANGSWYPGLDASLRPEGDKASPWGGPYHTGRALVGCLRLLDPIVAGTKGGCTPL
jgi:mannobiose 2-epimerase